MIDLKVTFKLKNKEWEVDTVDLKDLSKKVMNSIERDILIQGNISLSLVFLDDADIHKLNKEYRNNNQPTDVLSFSNLEGDIFPADKLADFELGEIFISLETAQRQASEHKLTLQEEVNKLFVHGLLHILGFDHDTEKHFQEMNFWEEKILNS